MDPFFHTGLSISDSLKTVRKSVLIDETIIDEHSCRKHIDVLLNSMNEKELVVMEATAEGLKKARETEVQK